MTKRLIILLSFFGLLLNLSSPVLAQSTDDNQEEKKDPWQSIFEFLLPIINPLFGIIKQSFIRPQYTTSVNYDSSTFTNYNATDKDSVSRSSSESFQTFNKGTYLNNILKGLYPDNTIAYLCDNSLSNEKSSDCTDVKWSHLVYYFYKKGQKIIYDPANSQVPIDYDTTKMESYDYDIPSGTETGFENLYKNMTKIPQGDFQNQSDAAAPSSKEYNNWVRQSLPASSQTNQTPSDISNPENVKILGVDNEYSQRAMFANFIPAKNQPGATTNSNNDSVLGISNISTDTQGLQNTFTKNLHPASWQSKEDNNITDDAPERDDWELGEWDITGGCKSSRDPSTCNAKKSHCRGMSQYGALGMALSGKNYEEILKYYYGNAVIKTIDSQNMNVKISLDDADDCPDGSSLNVEDYLKGLGEMPNYWGNLGNELSDGSHQGMNALRAQVIAARTYAYVRTNKFQKSICNSSRCQVFRCSKIGAKPNLSKAVDETKGQILVDAVSQAAFSTEYARSFCGSSRQVTCNSHTNPSVNGKDYEIQGLAATNRPPNAFCK